MDIAQIGYGQLLLSLLFVLAAGAASLVYQLKLERDLFWGTVRTFAQLFVMGYALKLLFGLRMGLPVLLVFCCMIGFAARIIHGRVKEPDVSYMLPTLLSMLGSYTLVTIIVTACIVRVEPWWMPQYFLPLGGMVIGNSMTAQAIALERLFSQLRQRREEVEMRLCLGATPAEASQTFLQQALKAGMIPSINSMMGVGFVSIPGMMTGQILAGADPMLAVRYQIVVMLMLVGSTALATLIVLNLVRNRCFGPGGRLLLRPRHG